MTDKSTEHHPGCWKLIGSSGDLTCSKLALRGHCRNCPDYAAAGRALFDRAIPQDYQAQWTEIIAKEKESNKTELISVIVFRIKREWLALKTSCFQEITSGRRIHSVPQRTNEIFKGLVNIGGELLLCLSMADILGIDEETEQHSGKDAYQRMAVVKGHGSRFVFAVNEVLGVNRIAPGEIQRAPATISKAATAFTSGIFSLDEKHIAFLKEQLLFDTISFQLQSFP
jgi:chemotaxis-related protein WspD